MKLLSTTALAAMTALPVSAASIDNGSLTGPLANGSVPAGWSITSFSPDTNDLTTAGGGFWNYDTPPVAASSDGGTWVGVAGGGLVEAFSQMVTDFVIGESYTLGWEQYNSGATFTAGYNGTNAFTVTLDGLDVGTGAYSDLGDPWLSTSVTFMATSTSHSLGFKLADDVDSYMNIDGIAFGEVPEIPLPPTALALLAGLGGLGAIRRRAR